MKSMFNKFIEGLYCIECNSLYEYDPLAMLCPKCSQPLITRYDLSGLSTALDRKSFRGRAQGMWKFSKVLPIDPTLRVSLGEGGTRLIKSTRLGERLGLKNLYLKVESLNPTGTFIDRGVSVDVSVALALKYRRVTTATLGDYGVSVSAYCARAGLRTLIFMPANVELNKLYQVIMLRGRVRLLKTYAQCVEEARGSSERYGYYLSLPSSHTVMDGYKTISYEILEESYWQIPDYVIAPVGDGALLSALYYGFKEATGLGLATGETPRIVAVQTSASPTIAAKVIGVRGPERASEPESIASDLLVLRPLMEAHAIHAIVESKGTAVIVSDSDILEAMHLLAKYEGVIVEPSSATAIAGLVKLVEEEGIDRDDRIVVVITGSSFKDPLLMRRVIEYSQEAREELSALEELRFSIGETKMKILEIIAINGQIHPYRIWKILNSSYGVSVKATTVYQHLRELEARGLVLKVTSLDRRRTLYKLTSLGEEIIRRRG